MARKSEAQTEKPGRQKPHPLLRALLPRPNRRPFPHPFRPNVHRIFRSGGSTFGSGSVWRRAL